MTTPKLAEYIESTPGVCGGKPRIKGHRITVQNVVIWYEQGGMSPEEIASQYPGITPAKVHAALAYYYDHRAEILAQIRADEELFERLRESQPSIIEKLERRLAKNDPLSSR